MSVDDREKLFQSIKKGKNDLGGTYGTYNKNVERERSPVDDSNRYNHSQKDPIIIRGDMNVIPNHLVIRKKEFQWFKKDFNIVKDQANAKKQLIFR